MLLCVSSVERCLAGSRQQPVRPEIAKTIRMIILIPFPQFHVRFSIAPVDGFKPPPALTGANSPAGGLTRTPQLPHPHPVPSLPSAGESQDEGLASGTPAAKSHAATLRLGTGFRCRNPRGHRQLHPLLALPQDSQRTPTPWSLVQASAPAWLRALLWTEGVGTAVGWVVGLGAPVHPASSTARSSAPAPSSPSSMDFDIIALPSAGFSAALASTVALRMTRRKVLVPMAAGVSIV